MKKLSDHLAEYRGKGLDTVAQRLTWPVFSSLYRCCIMFADAELCVYLRTHLLLDFSKDVNISNENIFKAMAAAERRGDHGSFERLRIQADDAVRDYAYRLDMRLASAYAILLHLNHINSFLNKRLHGNTRSRLAGSFVR